MINWLMLGNQITCFVLGQSVTSGKAANYNYRTAIILFLTEIIDEFNPLKMDFLFWYISKSLKSPVDNNQIITIA